MAYTRIARFLALSVVVFIVIKAVFLANKASVKIVENTLNEEKEKESKNLPIVKKQDGKDEQWYDHEVPLIFIGGSPRSGTTLIRTMLDAHPEIRCGPETRIVPNSLILLNRSIRDELLSGTLEKLVVEAFGEFILNIIQSNGPASKYLCDKDPMTSYTINILEDMFPRMKYVLMVRDPRAVAYSLKTRGINITGVDTNDYRTNFDFWNQIYLDSWSQCKETTQCLLVHYEDLVLRPVETTKDLFKFFNIFWSEDVLHHEKHLNNTIIVQNEPSTGQVEKALYLEALTSWFGKIPDDILREVPRLAPCMMEFGYNPYDLKPNYGEADDFVLKKGVWAEDCSPGVSK